MVRELRHGRWQRTALEAKLRRLDTLPKRRARKTRQRYCLSLAGPAALTHGVIGTHIVEFSTVVVCPVGHTMHVGGVVVVPATEI